MKATLKDQDQKKLPTDKALLEDEPISSCSFTGHRIINPLHSSFVDEKLRCAVEYLYERGCRVFYCGGAIGFDTLAAREVLRFRMSHRDVALRLVLPCTNQDAKWTEKQRDAYHYVLKRADSVEYVSDKFTETCMKERNARLAELGDVVVSYLYRSASGAAQTVRIAKRLGKDVYNLVPPRSH